MGACKQLTLKEGIVDYILATQKSNDFSIPKVIRELCKTIGTDECIKNIVSIKPNDGYDYTDLIKQVISTIHDNDILIVYNTYGTSDHGNIADFEDTCNKNTEELKSLNFTRMKWTDKLGGIPLMADARYHIYNNISGKKFIKNCKDNDLIRNEL